LRLPVCVSVDIRKVKKIRFEEVGIKVCVECVAAFTVSLSESEERGAENGHDEESDRQHCEERDPREVL